MPSKIIPITNLPEFGVVKDPPTVGLAPNIFTDAKNIRFRDMAVWKMKGETDLFSGNLDPTFTHDNSNCTKGKVKFVTYWANPNKEYYVYVIECKNSGNTYDRVIVRDPLGATEKDITPAALLYGFESTGYWQSTDFQGGFCLILNNGVNEPYYILDDVTNTTGITALMELDKLPGWDSYNAAPKVLEVTYKTTYGESAPTTITDAGLFDLGILVDWSTSYLHVTKQTPGESTTGVALVAATKDDGSANSQGSGTLGSETFVPGVKPPDNSTRPTAGNATTFSYCVWNSKASGKGTTIINLAKHGSSPYEAPFKTNDVITAHVVSRNPVKTTAGVVRSFNNILVAGNLKEADTAAPYKTIRNLTGVVRTSDVAAPGALPQNWNPFAGGANTADEFTLSDTSIVRDLVGLQGNLYIYTTTSIHAMRLTGNAFAPVSFSPVTSQYGCQTTDGVVEFDGRHLVVGSNDIYLFSGNPGNITSISDARVRDDFYKNYRAEAVNSLFTLRDQANDEIWICYPTDSSSSNCTEALIYNYKLNNWTRRTLTNVVSGVVAPVRGVSTSDADRNWADAILNKSKPFPILAQATADANNRVLVANVGYTFNGTNYTSYLERESLSVTPEFYTEAFSSIALLTQGTGTLNVKTLSSNSPGTTIDFTSNSTKTNTFNVASSYKSDARLNGRFISYRIDDGTNTTTSWNLAGIQIEVQDGGTR